jgi:hypothetical protein
MVKTLEQAFAEVKLKVLRRDIDEGIRSLDGGEGRPLDTDEFLRQKNQTRGAV